MGQIVALQLTGGQIMGEDIRHAKAIYENRWGFQPNAKPRTWLAFANEVREYLNLQTLQETSKHLGLNINI